MPFANPHVDCRVTGDRATLLTAVLYEGNTDVFVIPKGFATDFASVPRWATWAVPRMGAHTLAAIVHDWLCHLLREGRSPVSAVDADGIFRRIMAEEGVSFARRWIAWAGVRWGALGNDWHRVGWWKTFPQLLAVTLAVLIPVVALGGLLVWL